MKEGRAKTKNRSRKHPESVVAQLHGQSVLGARQAEANRGKVSVYRVTLQVCVSQEEKPMESCLEMTGICGLGI